jgi:hypothetical protein
VNPVGHYLHRFLHVSRVRGREKIREVSLEYCLNVSVMCLIVALIVKNVVDPVLSLSLSGFKVEKLGVFVSM